VLGDTADKLKIQMSDLGILKKQFCSDLAVLALSADKKKIKRDCNTICKASFSGGFSSSLTIAL